MSTPNIHYSEAADNARQVIDVFTRTNPSSWSQPMGFVARTKRWFGRFAALFCCMEDEWLNLEMESRCRDDIRRDMMSHYGLRPGVIDAPPVIAHIQSATTRVFNDTGYDMLNYRNDLNRLTVDAHLEAVDEARNQIAAMEEENATQPPEEEVPIDRAQVGTQIVTDYVSECMRGHCARLGLRADYQQLPVHTQARMIPHFSAQLTLLLRAKFGRLPYNDANRMLIEREYLRVCREGSVRYVDIALHQQWVMNTYFNEGVLEELATTRVRVPGWMRRLFGTTPSNPASVC